MSHLSSKPPPAQADWSKINSSDVRLVLDRPPAENVFSVKQMVSTVGRAAKDAAVVEVPFDKLAKLAGLTPDQFWTGSTAKCIEAPLGQAGARGVQLLTFGLGTAHHGVLIGQTGSGKTNLMHVLITTLALKYSPAELQLYLIDFKGGVGFKQYAVGHLPTARVIAIQSEREFGMSVLQGLDAEIKERSEKFRAAQVENLSEYRAKTGKPLPRLLLIVDEFQEFFQSQDEPAMQARLLFERMVRQGRAFGIHLLLASQSLSGSAELPATIREQMGVRVVLKCSESDARQVLSDDNRAARLLSRPGEGIYNDVSGQVEGNRPFQAALFTDEDWNKALAALTQLAAQENHRSAVCKPIIFEGNAPARLEECAPLASLIEQPQWPARQKAAMLWFGEPVAIRPPLSARLQRQAGRHLLVLAREEDEGMGILFSAFCSLLAHHAPTDGARFLILDQSQPETQWEGLAGLMQESFDHQIELLNRRTMADRIRALAKEAKERLEANANASPPAYLLLLGAHKARDLRPEEPSYSLSKKELSLSEHFHQLLRDGPEAGIHVLAWCDSLVNATRTFDRGMREFGLRVAGAMTVEDSRGFLDQPHAGRLDKPHRMIVLDEDRPGLCEKIRPYAIPEREWLRGLAAQLKKRPQRDD